MIAKVSGYPFNELMASLLYEEERQLGRRQLFMSVVGELGAWSLST